MNTLKWIFPTIFMITFYACEMQTDTPSADCRRVGYECTNGFTCVADSSGQYECVPVMEKVDMTGEGSLSDLDVPDLDVPDLEVPDSEIPDSEIPDSEIDLDLPDMMMLEVDLEIPDLELDLEVDASIEDALIDQGVAPAEIHLTSEIPSSLAILDSLTLTWEVQSATPVTVSHVVLCEGELIHCGTSIYYHQRIPGTLVSYNEAEQKYMYAAQFQVTPAGLYSLSINADIGQGQEELIALPATPLTVYVPMIPTDQYPEGPYGLEVGNVINPFRFTGFADTFIDADINGINEPMREISLAEFYQTNDPQAQLLLISVSTGWCPSCLRDVETLNRLHADYQGQGLRILSLFYQDDLYEVVDLFWLEDFASTYRINFPIAIDPLLLVNINGYVPTHYLIQPETMTILDVGLIDLESEISTFFSE